MAIRVGVVCQGVAEREGEYYLGEIDHSISNMCVCVCVCVEKSIDCHPPRRELIQSIHHTLACQLTKRGPARLEGT